MIAENGVHDFNLFDVLDCGVACDCYTSPIFVVMNLIADAGIEIVEVDEGQLKPWREAGEEVIDGWIAEPASRDLPQDGAQPLVQLRLLRRRARGAR